MSFSMTPPPPKPAPSPAQYQQQPPPPQQQPPPPQQQQQQQQQQQPQPQQPPPAYQYPVQQQQSPANASPYAVPPPAKRQRLSPHPNSPPPPYQNGTFHAPPANLPGSNAYGNPYAQSPQSQYSPNNFVASPQASFNTPQPYPPQQMAWQSAPTTPAPAVQRAQQQSTGSPQPNSAMMPPPPRPNKEEKEEKGVDDVTDVMHGSGINLKDEENYLHTLYTNQHSKDSFATQSSSFGSGTLSGGNSFNTLQGTSFDGNGNGAFAGTLGQAASQDDVEKEAKRKREVAAREKAERDQHHLNNPFLLGNVLRLRMDKIARESGVRLDVNGLYLLQQPAEPTKVMTNGTNSDGIVRPGSKIDQGAPFADILSLVSLAAGERVRGLLDDSHALARARVYGDHNRVPPDLSDLAIAPGNESKDETVQPENITGTEWDRLPDAPGGPEDNDTSSASKPVPTISFQAKITDTFRQLAEADRLAEQARIRKREARRKAAEAAAANEDGAAAEAEIAAATSSTPAGPEQPKMTKKEQMKQQKEAKNAVEAQSSTTTNQTAAMMAMGKKGKKYSWMSGGGAPSHTNRYIKPSATGGSGSASGGTSTPVKKEGGTPTANGESDDAGMAKWGEFKEEKGVQLRDWVGVLERDGRERKALQKAWISLK